MISSLTISLLGPMQVLLQGQPLPPLRSRKSLWLLALLILRGGRAVERDWLAGTLWPDVDQTNALANLRPALNSLRIGLGNQGNRLHSTRYTLQLDVEDAHVDVLLFDAAIAGGQIEALATAVELYRGPLMEGNTEEWVSQERSSREQAYLRALQSLAEAASTVGKHVVAADYWRRAVVVDPLWEVARRGQMEAVVKAGDSNTALQIYRDLVTVLRGTPHSVPDASTTALYQRLREEARQRALTPPSAPASGGKAIIQPLPEVKGYLPHALTDLVGREDERLEVAAQLQRARLVTLTGPGGIGKTRLALAVASDVVNSYPDGVWLIALDALTEGKGIVSQVTSVLAVKEETGKPLLESLIAYLQTKQLLLVLDNCEHILTACTELTGQLLSRCVGVRILATSRAALGMIGEIAWGVPSLATPDPHHLPMGRATAIRVLAAYESVQLFVERAQAIQRTFTLTGDTILSVAQICTRLGGLPLAIELAAARVKMMHVSEIAHRLNDYLSLLAGGNLGAPPRQQTLRATLDWSYDLLRAPERVLLARLSVFSGGCDLPAIEYVCSADGFDSESVLDVLRGLVDKSLVSFEERRAEEGSRYYLLETVRQYAGERLETSGEAERIQERHRDWYVTVAEEAKSHLNGSQQQVWMHRLQREQGNLRVLLDGNQVDKVSLRLVSALWKFWDIRGEYLTGRQYFKRILKNIEVSGEPDLSDLRAKVFNGAATLAFRQSDYIEAISFYEESLRLYRVLEDRTGVATILNNLAAVITAQGDYARALALYEEGLGIHRALGNKGGMALTLGNLGQGARLRSDLTAAKAFYEESLQLYREMDSPRNVRWALSGLSNVVGAQGDYPAAQAFAEESLSIARALEEKPAIVEVLITLGELSEAQGNLALARSLAEEAVSLSHAIGAQKIVAWSLLGLGRALHAQGDLASAQEKYEEVLSIARRIEERRGEGWALVYLGSVAIDRGDTAVSQTLYQESVAVFRLIHDMQGLARSMGGLACALFHQGRLPEATRLFGTSEALREKSGSLFYLKEQKMYKDLADRARERIGSDAFLEAWEEGHTLALEQAVAYAAEL